MINAACAISKSPIGEMPADARVSLSSMIEQAARANIVYVGERHFDPTHLSNELVLLKKLKKEKDFTLVWGLFSPEEKREGYGKPSEDIAACFYALKQGTPVEKTHAWESLEKSTGAYHPYFPEVKSIIAFLNDSDISVVPAAPNPGGKTRVEMSKNLKETIESVSGPIVAILGNTRVSDEYGHMGSVPSLVASSNPNRSGMVLLQGCSPSGKKMQLENGIYKMDNTLRPTYVAVGII